MKEYTILETARELGFTKNAVKYRMQKLPENVIRKSDDGIIYITAAGMEILRGQMGKKLQVDKENALSTKEPEKNRETTAQEPPKETEESQNNHERTEKETENVSGITAEKPEHNQARTRQEPVETSAMTRELAVLAAAVDALTAQLVVKDEQIASQARQIETLVESLKLAQQTAAGAQALHAGTMQKELSVAQTDSETGTEFIQNSENIDGIPQRKTTLAQKIKGLFKKNNS